MQSDGLTVADLCTRFLTAKLRKRESGELGLRMFGDYREVVGVRMKELLPSVSAQHSSTGSKQRGPSCFGLLTH